MKASFAGLVAGLLLALAAIAGGFTGFLLAVVLGAIGFAVAGRLSGEFDVLERFRGRRD
ncbi:MULTISPECIES: hypothetical protein [Glycomyces]|uniref:Membrane protein YeaQ/YmgE (Transglycosylase-associated protein family) n=2 Tax=Glycomyces TaxID=58113 RepID=A0A9X3PGU6_9ACTN|nr:hypothetical protein [Glycomyces lechevalierae]MDA1383441.1 hypothetical protein [Glycomyces lechevalierae]MDR7336447.1 putative membrane protein YeaQ/YmgE (transglycosylase-associated protein family) [Glycomyces lechevalierae]